MCKFDSIVSNLFTEQNVFIHSLHTTVLNWPCDIGI